MTGEIGSLEFQEKKSFKAPPKEWIDHRLANLRETLSKDTVSSALALKELLSPIMLEPILEEKDDFYGAVKECEEIASSPSAPHNDGGMDSRFRGNDRCGGGNDRNFKPYYIAHTKIRTLALLDDEYKGSNWYHWRRVEDSNLRSTYVDNGFRDRRIRPLCQLSVNNLGCSPSLS